MNNFTNTRSVLGIIPSPEFRANSASSSLSSDSSTSPVDVRISELRLLHSSLRSIIVDIQGTLQHVKKLELQVARMIKDIYSE